MSEVIRFRVVRVEPGLDVCHVVGESTGSPVRVADWFTRVERRDGTVDDCLMPVVELTPTGFVSRRLDLGGPDEGDVLTGRVTRTAGQRP